MLIPTWAISISIREIIMTYNFFGSPNLCNVRTILKCDKPTQDATRYVRVFPQNLRVECIYIGNDRRRQCRIFLGYTIYKDLLHPFYFSSTRVHFT